MRSRLPLFALLVVLGSFALPHAAHASIPFFGPIIPTGSNTCALGWGAVILVINNIIEFAITLAITIVAPIMIAWAGFLMVIEPASSGGHTKARGILKNTVLGIVVAMAGWLIVDAVMAVLYHPDSSTGWTGTWSSLITTGGLPACQIQTGAMQTLNQTTFSVTGTTASGGGVYVNGKTGALCSDSNTACSPSVILSSAAALSMSLSNAQATALSCIAMTESSGNPNTPNSRTGACGTFQITTQPGNWSNSSYHQSPCSTSSSCNDAQCNLQTALLMFKKQGYQPWTGKNPDGTYWNPNAVVCVQEYDNG